MAGSRKPLAAAAFAVALLVACGPPADECPRPVSGEARTGHYVLRPGTNTRITDVSVDVDRTAKTMTMSYVDGGKRYAKRYKLLTPP